MSAKKLNPLDQLISGLGIEFSKIPNYEKDMQDPDLKRVHIWVAVNIGNLHSTRDLVTNTFVPTVNKVITENKGYINTSNYKHILKTLTFDVDDLRFETIRLGYVFMFHKYENFIKDFMKLMEELSVDDTKETNITLEEYMIKKFNFKPKQWHLYPSIHKVQFISNCTKHADGKCKLDNPNHKAPVDFLNIPETETLKPTVKNFKDDINGLIESIPPLFRIVGFANVLRGFERGIDAKFTYEGQPDEPLYDKESKEKMKLEMSIIETSVKQIISLYKNL